MKNIDQNTKYKVRFSIINKMIIYFTFLFVIVVMLCTFLCIKRESKIHTQGFIQTGKQTSVNIASSVKSSLISTNCITIAEMIREYNVKGNIDIIYVKVVKPDGKVYWASDQIYYGDSIDSSLLFDKFTVLENYRFTKEKLHGILITSPFTTSDDTWYVITGFSNRFLNNKISSLIIHNMIFSSIICLLVILGAIVLTKSISNSLVKLTNTAKNILKGDGEYNEEITSKDEVGLLDRTITKILSDIKNTCTYLEISEKKYNTLINTASAAEIGILIFHVNEPQSRNIKYTNQFISDLSKFTQNEILNMTINELIYFEKKSDTEKTFMQLIQEKHFTNLPQSYLIGKDKIKIPISLSMGLTELNGMDTIICYIKDISKLTEAEKQLKNYSQNLEKMVGERTAELAKALDDLKKTQTQLLQSEKLASIGQLSAGIAHEINTPTQYVGDNTQFLQESFNDILLLLTKYHSLLEDVKTNSPSLEKIAELEKAVDESDIDYILDEIPLAINQSLEGIERISKIVQAIKDFSHFGESEKTDIDINKAIQSTITVARNEWKYVAEIQTDFDDSLEIVPCLPGEFNQVILNILINAAHAIKDVVSDDTSSIKGIIKISTCKKGNWVVIRISDTGAGIPEEIRDKVFDPFFTTKKVGRGTGQGLAISHNVIVQKLGGEISFETELDKGTTFIVRLPLNNVS